MDTNTGSKIFNHYSPWFHEFDEKVEEISQKPEDIFRRLYFALNKVLNSIDGKVGEGIIKPYIDLETYFSYLEETVELSNEKEKLKSYYDSVTRFYKQASCEKNIAELERPFKVGVMGVTATPINWGHVLTAFLAMNQLNLDTVVFLVHGILEHKLFSGTDDVPIEFRHCMTAKALMPFYPFLRYSDIAIKNNRDGEDVLNDLRSANSEKKIDFSYLAGIETENTQFFVAKKLNNFAKTIEHIKMEHTLQWGAIYRLPSEDLSAQQDFKQRIDNAKPELPIILITDKDINLGINSTEYRKNRNPKLVPPSIHEDVLEHGYYNESPNQNKCD